MRALRVPAFREVGRGAVRFGFVAAGLTRPLFAVVFTFPTFTFFFPAVLAAVFATTFVAAFVELAGDVAAAVFFRGSGLAGAPAALVPRGVTDAAPCFSRFGPVVAFAESAFCRLTRCAIAPKMQRM